MLAGILFAAVAATSQTPVASPANLAPETLGGLSLLITTDKTTGWCSNIQGTQYITTFGSDGTYVDTEKGTGLRSDLGTYEFKRLNATDLQVTYHVSSGGTWEGGDYVDVFHYTTPTVGTYHGWQTAGDCTYAGKFFVQP